MTLDTHVLTLEGPDLSGKTTFYETLHRTSNFKWNIQDRSSLSMICYARQFGRECDTLRGKLEVDLSNMNHRMVVLLPEFCLLEKRYHKRGDEVQSIESLRNLYDIFCDEVQKLGDRPNVMVLRENLGIDKHNELVSVWLTSLEASNAHQTGVMIRKYVLGSGIDEHTIDATLTGKFPDSYDHLILDNHSEGKYYRKILCDFQYKIEKEILGINEYNLPQDASSRRFYYSSDTCISSLHVLPRGKKMHFLCALRSIDVEKNVSIDLKFLEYLAFTFGKKYFPICEEYEMRVRLNSAHRRE